MSKRRFEISVESAAMLFPVLACLTKTDAMIVLVPVGEWSWSSEKL